MALGEEFAKKIDFLIQLHMFVSAYCKTWSGVEWSGFVKHGVDL